MSIRVIQWDGSPISTPGIYANVPMAKYHSASICVGPSISSSGLRTIFSESAMAYWIRSPFNPSALTPLDSRAFIIGRCCHHLVLGEADFKKHFIIRPDSYPDAKTGEMKKWTLQSKFCQNWEREAREDLKLEVIKPEELEMIKGMAGLQPWQKGLEDSGLMNNALVRAGALNGLVEHSIFAQDKETGIWLKSRPDVISLDCAEMNDFKTSNSIEDHKLTQTLDDFRYDIQGRLAAICLEQAADIKLTDFSLIFADKSEPHEIAVRTLKQGDMEDAEQDLRAALRTFALGMETGRWPGIHGGAKDARYLGRSDRGRERALARREQLSAEIFG